MKKIFILSILFFLNNKIFCQVESAQLGAEFQTVSMHRGLNGMQTYGSNEIKGSQFFYPTWSTGSVTTVNNEVISKDYSFLYDKVRQLLFIKYKDSSAILLAERNQINGFTLNHDGAHNFVSTALYDPSNKSDFFEVLVNDSNHYSLLKLVKTEFVKADQTDIQRMKDGDIYDKFIDSISYYISYKKGLPQKITFRENSLVRNFPLLKVKIADYYDLHNNETVDENFLMGCVQSFNN